MLDIFSVALGLSVTAALSMAILLCLKIKSTKKSTELLGTVGTVKPLEDEIITTNASPRVRPVSAAISNELVGHDSIDGGGAANNLQTSQIRTPSRAGERKLPDIPKDQNENNGSDLYATVGAVGGSDSEQEETEPMETSNHPYAKVRKVRDHPYATLEQAEAGRAPHHRHSHSDPHEHHHHQQAQHQQQHQQQPQQFFSGDSQDSSKGYTSISVREPLRHIRPPGSTPGAAGASLPPPPPPPQVNSSLNPNYAPVSEASDDMYAAIEDPTYLPTGNQSNSDTYDTYAVINLPDDEDQEDDEVALRSAHTYSQVDKSRKKAASTPAAAASSLTSAAAGASSNVEAMYAKVQKGGNSDNLPVGASAISHNPRASLGARPRVPPWPSPHGGHHDVNYSDFEVSHYDPSANKSSKEANTKDSSDGGYETVPQTLAGDSRVDDFGYEFVRSRSKRSQFDKLTFNKGNAAVGVGGGKEPGYETVRDRDPPPGEQLPPPLPRLTSHPGFIQEPPYARLQNTKDDELSEEGYETIPAATSRSRLDPGYESVKPDPGYESVRNPNRPGPGSEDPGYETVVQKRDPGGGGGADPGYESVKQDHRRLPGGVDPGYETVDKKEPGYESVSDRTMPNAAAPPPNSASVNNVNDPGYESVQEKSKAKANAGYETVAPSPPQQFSSIHVGTEAVVRINSTKPSLHNNNHKESASRTTSSSSSSVIVIEHKNQAVNLSNDAQDNKNDDDVLEEDTTVQDGGNVDTHIFV